MTVRNSWVTQGKEAAGFIDKAEFEQIKRQGDLAVHRWIDKQLEGTSVTVVLIGSETLNRSFVKYEICKSLQKGMRLSVFILTILGICALKKLIKRKCTYCYWILF